MKMEGQGRRQRAGTKGMGMTTKSKAMVRKRVNPELIG